MDVKVENARAVSGRGVFSAATGLGGPLFCSTATTTMNLWQSSVHISKYKLAIHWRVPHQDWMGKIKSTIFCVLSVLTLLFFTAGLGLGRVVDADALPCVEPTKVDQ